MRVLPWSCSIVFLLACAGASSPDMSGTRAAPVAFDLEEEEARDDDGEGYGGGPGFADQMKEKSGAKQRRRPKPSPSRPAPAPEPSVLIIKGSTAVDPSPEPEPPAEAADARVREWFPEAFVWQPSLQTDADGVAQLDLRVPDQLTTWRLLALAHDGEGQQTGTQHTFDTRLPVSVDPLVPGWLYTGDRLRILGRAQATQAVRGRMVIDAEGSLSGGGQGALSLSAGGSSLVPATVSATRSGAGTIRAELFGPQRLDGAVRPVTVRPRGRRITAQVGGLVPRTLSVNERGASEQQVSVRVFPGPLALFQAELDRIAEGPSAVSYAVLDGVRALSQNAKIEVDEPRLRTVRLRAWQRLVKQARSPSAGEAVQLLHGMQNPDDSLAQTLRARLVRTAVEGQRGDGSWSSRSRSTAQAVLVETSTALMALPEDQEGPRLRGAGALERLLPNVDDGFTAAWMLATGLVDEGLREGLQEKVLAGIHEVDGRHELRIAPDVVDANGRRPSQAQALAVTVLALQDAKLDWKGDLTSDLLQKWSASSGFGSGWADAVALRAIRATMPALDASVALTLTLDGETVGTGTLDPSQPAVPVVLAADRAGQLEIRASPPVPGLSFVVTHDAWVPFTGREKLAGVDLEISMGRLTAGERGWMEFTLAAPSGAVVELEQGIPAGTEVGAPSGRLSRHVIAADHVSMVTQAFGAGEVMTLRVPVTPQYAGELHTPPLVLRSGSQSVQLRPRVWRVGT